MENIGESNSADQFYRYKRPKLVARIEGRGNGIKTNTVNLVDIAKALERPPDYVLKFFGCELGAQTKYDKMSGTCIVNGAHDLNKLNELLESFTKKYVQCHQCGNPETRIRIKKEFIYLKCKACGATSDVDMRHRLNTYIIKNPPEDKISKAEKRLKKMEAERMKEAAGENLDKEAKAKKKKDKDGKKSKKTGNGDESPTASATDNAEDDEDEDEDEEGDDTVWMTDTSEAAVKARAAAQLTGATAEMVTQGNIEAEKAEARKREKAAKKDAERKAAEEKAYVAEKAEARKREKAAKKEAERKAAEEKARAEAEAKAKAEAEAKAKAEEEAARAKAEEERLAREADQKMRLEEDATGSHDPIVQALRDLVSSSSFTPKKATAKLKQLEFEGGVADRARVLYLALFGNLGSHKLGPAIEARAEVLQAEAGEDATKQVGQLVALEYLVGVALPDKLKQTAVALKALYDEDVIEEDVILAWFDKESAAKVLGVEPETAAAVRAAAKPFVEWLKEASDEEDEESDDE